MPLDTPGELPEWNEENLDLVVSVLYREVETDQALHRRLMSNPFEVLSERIKVPEDFAGGIFTVEKGRQSMALYVPAFGTQSEALPEGTTEAEPQGDYDILCTTKPPW